MNAFDQAFQAAALMGVTVCVAAGDGGSTDGVSDGRLHADFPASSPHVIACGGTRLVAQPQTDTVQSEVVWNDGANGGATGGGISQFFALPTWQSGAHVPPSGNVGHHVGRGLPDIAANADPVTGYQVRVDGSDLVIGGTSAVAPLWAGLIALVNQSLAKSVGYLNPSIYQQLASRSGLFRDITAGNNDNTHLGLGYSAAAGWDPCSGWGAVDGSGLVAALKGGVPAAAEARPPAAAQRGGRSGASSASEA
jgi:kumamolisin